MGSDGRVVDFDDGLGERAVAEQSRIFARICREREQIVDVADFAEMRADRVNEEKLQVDVPFDQVSPRLRFSAVE